MDPIFTLISASAFVENPRGLVGWSGLIILLSFTAWLQWKWRFFNKPYDLSRVFLFLGLLILTPIVSLVIGFRLSFSEAVPPSEFLIDQAEPIVMVFAAVPWVLAGGLLGPLSAAALAMVGGLMLGFWQTHSIFTPFEYMLLMTIFSAAVRQNFRTPSFRTLRHPIASALIMALIYPVLHLIVMLFTEHVLLMTRLDYAVQSLKSTYLVFGIEVIIAGIFAEAIFLTLPDHWRETTALEPSPAEKSLQIRFSVYMVPLVLALLLTLIIGDWIVAGKAARDMIRSRMQQNAVMVAESVPNFFQVGQNQITELAADPRLISSNPIELTDLLSKEIKNVPFFYQLSVYDQNRELIASYPTAYYVGPQAPIDEQIALQVALEGMPFQNVTIAPVEGQKTAQISFITVAYDQAGKPQRLLVGRSDLGTNPYSKPIISGLFSQSEPNDIGMLIDDNQHILVHPDPEMVMTTYIGPTSEDPQDFVYTLPDGTQMLAHYQPADGNPLAIVMMVPVYQAQQLALQIAIPLIAMIGILSVISLIVLRFGLRMVTASLNTLAQEAGRIAQGKLDQPLKIDSVDEVGQLRRAFEQMRISLKERLEELNRLLVVSQGVASSLEISEAVQPILEAALAAGASTARVVLTPNVMGDQDGIAPIPLSFGAAPSQNLYSDLDEQILALTRQQDRLVLSNLYRPRLLNIAPGSLHPESIMAVALKHESQYYGSLWIAYDRTHIFSEEEVRFIVTLGGQAALAAANARLFLSAEIGRQRLESILSSSPDAVLVIDQREQLLLANPAAWQVLGLTAEDSNRNLPVSQVIHEPELQGILRPTNPERQSIEITLAGGRIFLATASPVLAEGQRVGRVCVMRDVTHFKELDALKSEFVSTVSHDLRSPLTLMRGYATMLEMVGPLNEQQNGYVGKITMGVESMSRLVNNLLDLGRIKSGVGLQIKSVNVQEVMEKVLSALQLQAAQKHIQLTSEIPEEHIPSVEADQALLQQALQNLVENAIKFTRPEGKIHVRLRVQPVGILFEVIDNGTGISPVDQPRLFERFYRGVQQGTKETRGTGLGLAIVKSIAERHGGRVWAESQLGKGSTFYLAIPVQQGIQETEK